MSIDQQSKSGFLSGTTHSYNLNVQFKLNEKEKKVFNEHPLFQDMIFMSYLAGKKKDLELHITGKHIYEAKPITIEASGVNEVIDYRNEVVKAGEIFANYVGILSDLIGAKEMTFGEE